MADVLEDKRNIWEPNLGTQQVIMIILKLRVCEVIPSSNH